MGWGRLGLWALLGTTALSTKFPTGGMSKEISYTYITFDTHSILMYAPTFAIKNISPYLLQKKY